MKRIIYTISKAFKYRQALKKVPGVAAVANLNFESLHQSGIEAIVFDFDGVLASHGEIEPNQQGRSALDHALKVYSKQVYILSNKPLQSRLEFFNHYYPSIQFITAKKKPYPDGLLTIVERAKLLPGEVLLIDDRLLTGALAAVQAGVRCCLIKSPFANFSKRPLKESFFALLRFIEGLIV